MEKIRKIDSDMYVILPSNFKNAFLLKKVSADIYGNPRLELTSDTDGIQKMLEKGFKKKRNSKNQAVIQSFDDTENIAEWIVNELENMERGRE